MLSGQALAMTSGQWIVLTGGGPRQPVPVAEATCQEVIVSQVRVHNFSVSLDGFGTGDGAKPGGPVRACGNPAARVVLRDPYLPRHAGPALAAGLIDYAHIVVVPIVLGRGERLWDGWRGSKNGSGLRP